MGFEGGERLDLSQALETQMAKGKALGTDNRVLLVLVSSYDCLKKPPFETLYTKHSN